MARKSSSDSPPNKPPQAGAAQARGKPVGAVVAAIKVFRALHDAQRPLSASEVARATSLYRGTAFNILRTLQHQGLLVFDQDRSTYYIGTQLLEFAHGVLRTSGLMDTVRPEMFSLAETCGATIFIAKVSDNYDLVLLDIVGGGFRADAYSGVGRRSPRFSGASGVIMAAFSGVSMDYVADQYDATEWFKKPTSPDFFWRVRETKRLGYAVDRGNRRNGLTQVAVPVFHNTTGKLSMVITAVAFSYAMNERNIKSVAKHVRACADRIAGQQAKLRLD